MTIYRLDPIDPGHSTWDYSQEKNSVWACAPTGAEARDLVAAKSGFAAIAVPGARSPWQNAAVTSCVSQPTMTHLSLGEVIRQDGSTVAYD